MFESEPAFARRARRLCLLVIGTCLGASAWAQSEPPVVGCEAGGPLVAGNANTTYTTSCSRTPDTFTDNQLPDKRVDTYRTRLTGLLLGNATLFYDQEFALPFNDTAVQDGVTAAMAVLTSANSGNPLSFQTPALTGSQSSLLDSQSIATVVGPPLESLEVGIGETTGPEIVRIGNLGMCDAPLVTGTFAFPYVNGFNTVSNYPFGCVAGASGTYYDAAVIAGTINFNANLNYQYHFTRDVQLTETWELFETWTLVGVADPGEAGVPEPGALSMLLLGALGLFAHRRSRRLRRPA
ncbi:MAG: PEP-CTERM sorting domain-containing protein [Burkholderiaceae bacterium]|nr:PEP-CTERM sorting domain-containing protein [Burkholderiaceae bacterium]